MPVDFTGWCCGLVVWIGGTVAVAVTAKRLHSARPGQPDHAPFAATLAAAVVLFVVGVAIGALYDILSTRRN